MKPVLKIFITEHCSGCVEARRIAAEVGQSYPYLRVEVIDLETSDVVVPEAVFATPTYMLGERVVSLGNPDPAEVARWATAARVNSIQATKQ